MKSHRKRMAIISPGFLPVPAIRGGAIELFIEKTLPYLKKEFDITVFSIADSNLKIQNDFRYIPNHDWAKVSFSLRHFKDGRWNYIHQVGLSLKKESFEIIYYHGRPEPLHYLLQQFKPPQKIIAHFQNDQLGEIKENQVQLILKQCHQMIVCSSFLKNKIIQDYAYRNINVLHNGVDIHLYQKSLNRSFIQKKYNLPKNTFIYCYSGRWVKEKGLAELVSSFQKIKKLHSNIYLLLVGGADQGNENRKFYLRLIKSIQADPARILVHGFVPPNLLPSVYQSSDVFVGPSKWDEPLGIVFLEAKASGLPIITTHRGGIPEIVKNNSNGLLIEDVNHLEEELMLKMQKLFSDQKLRTRFKEKNIKESKKHDWQAVAQKLISILRSSHTKTN